MRSLYSATRCHIPTVQYRLSQKVNLHWDICKPVNIVYFSRSFKHEAFKPHASRTRTGVRQTNTQVDIISVLSLSLSFLALLFLSAYDSFWKDRGGFDFLDRALDAKILGKEVFRALEGTVSQPASTRSNSIHDAVQQLYLLAHLLLPFCSLPTHTRTPISLSNAPRASFPWIKA